MGSLIVLEEGVVCGIVTDRDITIRAVAEELDVRSKPVGEICSQEPLALSVSDSIEQAIELMRSNSIRWLPVLDEKGRPAGIVSLGDWPSSAAGPRLSAISVGRLPTAERGLKPDLNSLSPGLGRAERTPVSSR